MGEVVEQHRARGLCGRPAERCEQLVPRPCAGGELCRLEGTESVPITCHGAWAKAKPRWPAACKRAGRP